MKYAVFVWLIVTLFMNYQIAYNSTYRSDAPNMKFWNRLPMTALICGVVVFGIYGIYRAMKKGNSK